MFSRAGGDYGEMKEINYRDERERERIINCSDSLWCEAVNF